MVAYRCINDDLAELTNLTDQSVTATLTGADWADAAESANFGREGAALIDHGHDGAGGQAGHEMSASPARSSK